MSFWIFLPYQAELHIEALGEMVSNTGSYINGADETKQLDVEDFDFQLTFELLDLQKITAEGGAEKWNRAVFKLAHEGKFDMEFSWDQASQGEVQRLARA